MIDVLDINTARKVSYDYVLKSDILPLYEENNLVHVISCVDNPAEEHIEFIFRKKSEVHKVSNEIFKDIVSIAFSGKKDNIAEIILLEAYEKNASDIHFEPDKENVTIRIRVDGVLIVVRKIMISEYNNLLSKLKIKSGMDITEKRVPQDGKLTIDIDEYNFDIRVSTLPVVRGEKLVLRILKKNLLDTGIESMKFTDIQKEKIKNIMLGKNGVVLICGPTGSGKSTTLYSMLSEIKSSEVNITTLEDPIEIEIEGINQVALNNKVNLGFAEGLRSILRQDTD